MPSIATPTDSIWVLSGQLSGGEPGRDVSIHTLPFQVGRRPDLPFSIPSPTVSNLHAEIVRHGSGGLLLRDLGSTNGTFVNGKRLLDETVLESGDLVQFADLVFRLRRKSAGGITQTATGDNCAQALALIQFDKLMSERAVVPYLQPITHLESRVNVGFEVLGRSNLFGLKEPKAMFRAASQLNLEAELSRMFRWEGIRCSQKLPGRPPLFLNTHPVELEDLELLILSMQEAREAYPEHAFTLEIHESAITDPTIMRRLQTSLAALQVSVAYDDFGAGQARLIELADVPPDYLKFDIQLIKNIHLASEQRQRMLASLAGMVRDLGIQSIAEGIECDEEATVCAQMGIPLGQGYYLGRPAPIATWMPAGTDADSTIRRVAR